MRLQTRVQEKVDGGGKALVTYLTAGLPSPDEFVAAAVALAAVSDALEIGIPFSDPVMDGPVIQEASVRALDMGVTPRLALELAAKVRAETDTPLVAMTYYNPVHQIGESQFVKDLQEAGVEGVIVPDLPLEESGDLHEALHEMDVAHIQLVAPTTTSTRAEKIARASSGFLYAVSRLGVTGEQESLARAAGSVVSMVRPFARCPVILGFGISDARQATEAASVADGVVMASALMRRVMEGKVGEAVALAAEVRDSLATMAGRPE